MRRGVGGFLGSGFGFLKGTLTVLPRYFLQQACDTYMYTCARALLEPA